MTEPQPFPKRRLVALTVVAFVAAIWLYRQLPLSEAQRRRITVEARMWLNRGGFDEAEQLMQRLADDAPYDDDAHSVAAELSVRRRNYEAVQRMLTAIVDADTRLAAVEACARICMDQGVVSDAAALYQQAIDIAPEDLDSIIELVRIYRISGLNYEALPLLKTLVARGEAETRDLGMLQLPNRFWAHENDMTFAQSKHSLGERDILLEIAYGHSLYRRRQPDDALKIAQRILDSSPEFVPAIALKGRALVDLNRDADLITWNHDVPTSAESHPDIWFVRARLQQRHSNESAAARCFWECLNRDVRHRAAWYHLAQTLHALERNEQAKIAEHQAEQLAQIQKEIVNFDTFRQPEFVERLITLSRAANAYWEAAAWCNLANRRWSTFPEIERACSNDDVDLLTSSVDEKDQRLLAIADLASIPLPAIDNPIAPAVIAAPEDRHVDVCRFELTSPDVFPEFRFFDSKDPSGNRAYMFEFSGPGVAVVDIDSDQFPDLYLTQGAPWPVDAELTAYHNRLFRNLDGAAFDDVSYETGLADNGFGQGAAIGDLNNDGFPDVYLCNIGPNVLFWNNGDGTFSRAPATPATAGDDWSISAVIADLGGDPSPEIYVANYLGGSDVFVRICRERGKAIQCYPQFFPAAQDRLLMNRSDGGFDDRTRQSGCELPDGKGMGVIVTSLDDQRLGILVANDTTANRLLVREAHEAGAEPRFSDWGQLAGIAFDDHGAARSSMGVDAGDINADGRPDFFVTNFYEETNNLYVSQPGGTYEDESLARGLSAAGYSTEGWGVRFVDGDNDGDLDLFVANGHLDDWLSGSGRMKPHLFTNTNGYFSMSSPDIAGPYFSQDTFGRSVAQLDWNRDGLEDLCVTHLRSPVALLTNQTDDAGSFIAFQLIGTSCSRDAIGASLTVTRGDQSITRHLTAGGYAATSTRRIPVGLGSLTHADSVTIHWPDGTRDIWNNLSADKTYYCIQSAGVFEAVD